MSRPSWDAYLLGLAVAASKRSSCNRAQVGAVIALENRPLVTGYNGALSKTPSCDEVGHAMVNNHCQRAVHAETNAIAQAARHGVSLLRASAYLTHYPCWQCFRLLVAAGVREVVYLTSYRPDELVLDHAILLGIEMRQVVIEEGSAP